VIEILDRGNGARICTRSGATCGQLFALEEVMVTRYVRLKPFGSRGYDKNNDAAFQTKLAKDWKSHCATSHPKLGYVEWHVIGQIDGKLIAIFGESESKIFLFDRDEIEANPEAYEESSSDLGVLILEALNRP